MNSLKKICPVPGCKLPIGHRKLMCRYHWRNVPMHLQREIWSSWRNKNMPVWREAKDRAIAAVTISGGGEFFNRTLQFK